MKGGGNGRVDTEIHLGYEGPDRAIRCRPLRRAGGTKLLDRDGVHAPGEVSHCALFLLVAAPTIARATDAGPQARTLPTRASTSATAPRTSGRRASGSTAESRRSDLSSRSRVRWRPSEVS